MKVDNNKFLKEIHEYNQVNKDNADTDKVALHNEIMKRFSKLKQLIVPDKKI